MAGQVRCVGCGKVLAATPEEAGAGKLVCPACGTLVRGPIGERPPQPVRRDRGAVRMPKGETSDDAPPLPGPPPQGGKERSRRLTVGLGVACAVLAVALVVVVIVLLLRRDGPGGEDGFWAEHGPRVAQLKSEAEKLAIAGDLAAAHEKYRQIEGLVAGRRIKESAAWDLIERAKQDQDRIYSVFLLRQHAQAAAALAAAEAATRPAPMPEPQAPVALVPYPDAFDPPAPPVPPEGSASDHVPTTRPMTAPAAVPVAMPATLPTLPATAPATAPANASGHPVAPVRLLPEPVTDEQIGEAIARGTDFLLAQFPERDQVKLRDAPNDAHAEAVNALAVYALLHAGKATGDVRLTLRDKSMRDKVDRMKDHLMSATQVNSNAPVVYGRALRAMAVSVYNRPEDRAALTDDVRYLLKAHKDGAFTYNDRLSKWDQPRSNLPEGGGLLRPDVSIPRRIDPEKLGARDPSTVYHVTPGSGALPQHNGEPRVPKPVPPDSPLWELYVEPPGMPWDNSNTQYGLLGVWAAAEAGLEVPSDFWVAADRHWKRWILPTGEWGYNARSQRGHFAMTAAGVGCLFVTHDILEAPAFGPQVGREPYSPELARALAWLEQADNAVTVEHGPVYYRGYSLHALERAAHACGFKSFGRHDWYRTLAAKVVRTQHANGAWGRNDAGDGAVVDTAYMVLFLSRGRHPVMVNKLRFGEGTGANRGYWHNRPRDAANLARFASLELERPLNWQVVSLQRDWSDWMDAPVLYLASHQAPKLADADVGKLRAYALAGGLIFTHADGSSSRFNEFASQLAKRLFPDHELANLPAEHPLWSAHHAIKSKPLPQLKAVGNGSRLLMVHSPTDLSAAWQVRDGTRRLPWEVGMNLYAYAGGKHNPRNRLASPHVGEVFVPKALRAVPLMRVRYAGNHDPEPWAWTRLGRILAARTSWQLQPGPVDLPSLRGSPGALAHWTGTAAYRASADDVAAIGRFIDAGGVLLIDDCGGSGAFADSARAAVAAALEGVRAVPLDEAHPLARATFPGMLDLSARDRLRPYAVEKLGERAGRVELFDAGPGKGKVVFCPLDLSTSLLGTRTHAVAGYTSSYAEALAQNVILWAANQGP